MVAILLIIVFQILNGAFLSLDNLEVVLQLGAEIAIVAVAEVMVMVLGEIDLSIGNVFALAPFVMYLGYKAGLPLIVAIVCGLLSGLAVGLVNAVLHVKCIDDSNHPAQQSSQGKIEHANTGRRNSHFTTADRITANGYCVDAKPTAGKQKMPDGNHDDCPQYDTPRRRAHGPRNPPRTGCNLRKAIRNY